MKIIIKDANKDRITAAIREAEGRATTRTITYEDMQKAITRVECTLGISKKAMEGIEVWVDWNAQTFPNAYRHIPYSTQFHMTRTSSGWALDAVSRYSTGRSDKQFSLQLTEAAKAAIIESMERF